ncbi:MAG: ABC transporter permease, partial [Holophagales bacterium]|nr:ABC transporter permease [Holophagales bacterium]
VYRLPQRPGQLVHALEHGSVVIYYDQPGPEALATLKDWAGLYTGTWDGVVLTPMDGLGEEVVLNAWTKTLRRPVTLTFSLVQPLVWMAFFGFLFERYPLADLGTTRYLDFLAPGVCAMTVLFGASQSGIGWIRDHQTGFLGRLLHTPASPSAILAGKVLADVLRLLVQATAALLLALALGAELRPGPNLVPGMVGLALFAAGFSSLSCAIALRTRAQETMATFVHLVNMPLLFTSTALVPRRQMPDWLGRVAEHNPLSHAVETVRAPLLYGQEPAPASLLLLTLFATLLFTLARHETHRLYHGGS